MEKLEKEQVPNIWLKVVSQKRRFILANGNHSLDICTNTFILSAKAKKNKGQFL